MKLNLGCGSSKLNGFINLDKNIGWTWESGIPYKNETIEAITESHSIMYVNDKDWPFIFNEIKRVLIPGGIIRITEDATDNPESKWFGGHPTAISLTSFKKISDYLFDFNVFKVAYDFSYFKDKSLLQDLHGGEPKVFFLEAIKKI
jgi:ubiquinone/menaquinone biosynthesis C-methylase UbiE